MYTHAAVPRMQQHWTLKKREPVEALDIFYVRCHATRNFRHSRSGCPGKFLLHHELGFGSTGMYCWQSIGVVKLKRAAQKTTDQLTLVVA